MVPATQDFVRDSQCGCTVSEVLRMERVVLDKLKWELNFVNGLDFLQIVSFILTLYSISDFSQSKYRMSY